MLELPRRGSSNEYPQSMIWSKNKKNRYTPALLPQFYNIKVGFKGVYISQTCLLDVKQILPRGLDNTQESGGSVPT